MVQSDKLIVIIFSLMLLVSCSNLNVNENKYENKIKNEIKNDIETEINVLENETKDELNEYGSSEETKYSKGETKTDCADKIVKFTFPPRRFEDIEMIEPIGMMIGGHVTPIDHQYYYPPGWKPEPEVEDLRDVLAPADGTVINIQRMPSFFTKIKNKGLKDYRIVIQHSCSLSTIYIHIYELSDKIEQEVADLKPSENKQLRVSVKAGEIIGRANSFDFSAHDENVILKGFIVPEHYAREPWKIHTVDPYDYFEEPIRTQLLSKNIRTEIPYGGKIDHDIDGKLIGNWFEEKTNWYMGIKQPEYWETHLAIAPDALDPAHIIISLGNFSEEAKQFGVKENFPNPADVGVNYGLVKYELVDYNYLDENKMYWDGLRFTKGLKAENQDLQVQGTVLLQLVDSRKLKVEVFSGKKAFEIEGFTENAKTYER